MKIVNQLTPAQKTLLANWLEAGVQIGTADGKTVWLVAGTEETAIITPPVIAPSTGIWVSPAKLAALPRTGAAWDAVNAVANGSLGTPNLSDIDSAHPEKTFGCALAAVTTASQVLRDKAVAAILSAIGTENNQGDCPVSGLGGRGLAIGRNLLAYVLAADVLDLRAGGYNPSGKGAQVETWIGYMRTRPFCNASAGNGLPTEMIMDDRPIFGGKCASNGCSMVLASRIACAAYLKDPTDLAKDWMIFRRLMGDATSPVVIDFNDNGLKWAGSPPFAITPAGALASGGYPADGAIGNDQGRGGSPPSSAASAPGYTSYPWDGLQGMFASALMLDRAGFKLNGQTPWQIGNSALLRAVKFQAGLQAKFGGSWYDSVRAAWVKHLAGVVYGFRPYPVNASGGGRNLDFAQFTHSTLP